MLGLLLVILMGSGPEESPVPKAFDTYWMVFLKKGEARDQNEEDSARIQREHLAHLKSLFDEGKLLVAGPLEVDADYAIRGLVIYPGDMDQETVRKLAEADPAVKAGRLKVEVIKWWMPKGVMKFEKTPY